MGLPLSDLIEPLRLALDDNDPAFEEFSDETLIKYLKHGVSALKASWIQDIDYRVVVNNQDPDNEYFEIEPVPPEWFQVLIVIKVALMHVTYVQKNSYDNKVLKQTRTSKVEDYKQLKEIYDEILEERRYSFPGCASNSFDDYFTRGNLIINEILEGFR